MIKDGKILLLQDISIDSNLPKFKRDIDSNTGFGIVSGSNFVSNNWMGSKRKYR